MEEELPPERDERGGDDREQERLDGNPQLERESNFLDNFGSERN